MQGNWQGSKKRLNHSTQIKPVLKIIKGRMKGKPAKGRGLQMLYDLTKGDGYEQLKSGRDGDIYIGMLSENSIKTED